MTRCVTPTSPRRRTTLAALVTAGLLAASAAPPASAQVQRNFPATALRGKLTFTNPPDVTLNGDAARLAPGMRIHGQDNMLMMTGVLAGVTAVVDYTLESNGMIYEIWLLRPQEAAVRPWPRTTAEATAWSFDYGAQAWTKP